MRPPRDGSIDHEAGADDEEALKWLLAQSSGMIETTVSGWNRTKVFRRLKKWAHEEHIARSLRAEGRSVIAAIMTKMDQLPDFEQSLPDVIKEIAEEKCFPEAKGPSENYHSRGGAFGAIV